MAKINSETLLRGDYLLLQKCSNYQEDLAYQHLGLFVPLPLPTPGSNLNYSYSVGSRASVYKGHRDVTTQADDLCLQCMD